MKRPEISKTKTVLGGIALVLAFVMAPARAGVVTFATGDFSSGEWSSFIDPTSSGTALVTTEAADGNPGQYRRISLTVAPYESVRAFDIWSGAQFEPASQGAISAVAVSYDLARVYTSHPGATQIPKGIAVQQDGIVYGQSVGVSAAAPPDWESVSVADIVPMFTSVNWVNGSTIRFGFYDTVSTSDVGFTIDGGYDNFQVQVTYAPVPEPAAWPLVVAGGAGLVCLLRRRLAGAQR